MSTLSTRAAFFLAFKDATATEPPDVIIPKSGPVTIASCSGQSPMPSRSTGGFYLDDYGNSV